MTSSRWMRLSLIAVAIGFGVAACTQSRLNAAKSLTPSSTLPDSADSPDSSERRSRGDQEVIYGDDNRVDYYEETDGSLRDLSESTVALMSKSQIASSVNGLNRLTGSNYGKSLGLCPDERFVDQTTGAFCSGFLVAPDTIVTAGHCVPDLKSCLETSYVFGYRIAVIGQPPTSVSTNEVYRCASLVHTQMPSDGADFAIVKLNRSVPNHLPLNLRLSGTIAAGTDLTVLGYPEGLPLKIAGGAQVRSIATPGFFTANTDTYGGNYGSAVINSVTHQVEGVLVRGEKDFEWSPQGCARSLRCKADACRGEDVTRISDVIKAINAPPAP